jgi:peptidoglycan/xylan/chitin deacetylase (PgdA/CDA1 family)
MKKIILGFVLGFSFAGVGVGAYSTLSNVYDMTGIHKIVVNKENLDMGEYKLLNYNSRSYVPLRLIAETLGEEVDFDEVTKTIYIGEKPKVKKSKVLMFHNIVKTDAEVINDWTVTESYIESVLQDINTKGLTTGFLQEDADVYITLDDGYKSNYYLLFPLLKKYNIKATIFSNSDHMYYGEHGSNHFTWAQAEEMSDSGLVEIQAHTTGHYKLTTLTAQQIQQDCDELKAEFLAHNLPAPNKFAYPFGAYNAEVQQVINANYEYVATSVVSIWDIETNQMIPRYNITEGTANIFEY